MNGWYALLWLASVVAVFSIPLIMFVLLMRLVGRITTRTLITILSADVILLGTAGYFWYGI